MTRGRDSAITRRRFLGLAGAGAAAAALPRRALAAGAKRPNILLIMADDMGWSDIGCYGGEIATPNIDRIASGGMRFTHAYNNAKCAPTRASLMTGLYSQQVDEDRLKNCVTFGEVLREAGYRTLMTGKWHHAGIPVKRGFDRYYGLTDGCCNFFNPGKQRPGEPPPGRKRSKRRWAIDDKVYYPYTPEDRKFYTTDAFTDYAVKYLEEYRGEAKPFFLYVAYTAPHYPLHAWPEDIAKYRGKYMIGWDELRRQRYKRQLAMGLVESRWGMSPRDGGVRSWESTGDKKAWDLKMAVYAAMIDRMDQGIGRIMDTIRKLGKEDNTLVMFLADNGGCAERVHKTPKIPPGPLESYRTVDPPWANASNTPFRKYKSWDHEGGISTPLVACWPKVIKPGTITHEVAHIIDFMATFVDVAGAKYPATYKGKKVLPLEGKSLLPVFEGGTREGHDAIFWQFGKCRAVRRGRWKLVGSGSRWSLHDMETDRCELKDLARAHPDKAKELEALWNEWAARVGAKGAPKKGGRSKRR